MLKLHFTIALRNLWKNKVLSLINVTGLAIGLAASLVLILYVFHEWTYDRNFPNADRNYQVMVNFKDPAGHVKETLSITGNVLGPAMKNSVAAIRYMTRIDAGERVIGVARNSFKKQGLFADPDILHMFSYKFLSGNPANALKAPNAVVLTKSTARLLFKDNDALNQVVRYNDAVYLRVTGIIEDLPANVSNRFDYLMPWSLNEQLNVWIKQPQWTNYNWQTLVTLHNQADLAAVNRQIGGMIRKNAPEASEYPFLYPLSKKHLYGEFKNGVAVGGRIEQLRLFVLLAAGILLIACINFMNLATARSEKRAREVGIRKTIGATRRSLIWQFMAESVVLVLISMVIAAIMVEVMLPVFNNKLAMQLEVTQLGWTYWLAIAMIGFGTAVVAGSYPAFYLSRFDPLQTLKSAPVRPGMLAVNLRKVLVVGQFCFAVILIIATLVVHRQISYLKNRPAGYNVEALVEVQQEGRLWQYDAYRDQLLKSGVVRSVAKSSGTLSNAGSSTWNLEWRGMAETDKQIHFDQIGTTYDFVKTAGLRLVAGRDFSPEFASDTAGVLLSEASVKVMNLRDPVGERIVYHGEKRQVVGVFADFIWGSPNKRHSPMIIAYNPGWSGNVLISLKDKNQLQRSMEEITRITQAFNPGFPAAPRFVSDLYAEKFKAERTLGLLANVFGVLGIFISSLGLFGLAAFATEVRTKEIGIRRVLGASVTSIVGMLSLTFLKMVLVAIGLGIPIAVYVMDRWLQKFELHTSVNWWVIATAAGGTILLALLTVSFHSWKAARSNPVQALKYE